jgi:hypothetical protein
MKSKNKILSGCLLAALSTLSTGCAEMLGVHVSRFSHEGTEYVKCIIVADPNQHDMNERYIATCREALGQTGGRRPQGGNVNH